MSDLADPIDPNKAQRTLYHANADGENVDKQSPPKAKPAAAGRMTTNTCIQPAILRIVRLRKRESSDK